MALRGRPRSFDRDLALRQALTVFREHGFEGATLSALLAAMGDISPPSFYAAFGSKEALFEEAVALYCGTIAAEPARALEGELPARAAIEATLRAAATSFCKPGEPRGCLLVVGALNGSSPAPQELLRKSRQQGSKRITKRLKQAVADGEIPTSVDVAALGSFYTAVLHGLAIQARDGVSRESLLTVVDCAMAAWDRLVGARRR